MKIIKASDTYENKNSDLCVMREYDFKDVEIDFSTGYVKGRYPSSGFCVNEKVKEMVYILNGGGILNFKSGEKVSFQKGDALLIEKGEPYFWDADCEIAISCTPAWTPQQHKLIK